MERNRFVNYLIGILCLMGCGAKGGIVFNQMISDSLALEQRPNVIIVLTDDQGFADLSCHGNPVLLTPAIDKLYSESIRLNNFHASPLCTPTRGQLMTGLDAMRNRAATVGRGLGLMRRDVVTLPEILQRNGYRTGIFGKWHLGDNYPDRPMDRGFQKAAWIKGWGIFSEVEYDNDYYKTRYLDSLETVYSNKYCTDLWFDLAMEWMDKMRESKQPFFTYLALNAPHGPFDAPEEDERFYREKVEYPKVASFFGMIGNIDRNMARLNDWLVRRNLRDNTLLIFMTDNGSAAGATFYNAGMRGEKGSNYDGGHRVPCFIRWPNGNLGPARTEDVAAQVQDLLPTLIDLLDLESDGGYRFDGASLVPILKRTDNDFLNNRMLVVQYAGLEDLQQKYFSAVVWNSWRLVGKDELYDLNNDPGQRHNIADVHPEVFRKMKAYYDTWWEGVKPSIDKYVPLVVGAGEYPTILSSDSWTDGSINTYWKVAAAAGANRGGAWPIHVEQEGTYRLHLSRWPFHLERQLTIAGPAHAVGGKPLNPGKALPIDVGCVALNDNPLVTGRASQGATQITIDMNLPRGDSFLQAWFRDSEGRDICGAYFLKLERMGDTN